MNAEKMYKRWQIDKIKNGESTEFDKYKSNDEYIFFFFYVS